MRPSHLFVAVVLVGSIARAQSPPAPAAAPVKEKTPPTEHDPSEEKATTFREHKDGQGATVASGAWGTMVVSIYASIRYLNQRAIEETYTDDTGTTVDLDRRDDLQFQKVMLYTKGWFADPAFRYLTYVWTSNAIQGLGAQVVVAGNLSYKLADEFAVGAGIGSLPTTRSTRGNFPRWLKMDNRTIADEYFRGSYTGGLWAWGTVAGAFHYRAMIGNNLSQLGVDAGQLDLGMRTYSGALWWTTSTFKAYEGFGDFEHHAELAASVGAAFTQSREDAQGQPGTNAPDNTQIRTSDGRVIFAPDAFGVGTQIDRATYRMLAIDGAVKWHGLALEGEVFYRWIDDLAAVGPLPISNLRDAGFQLQASGMVVPERVMLYASGSMIFGDFGDPWDLGLGINYFPFHNRVVRLNGELLLVDRSPVGNLSSPLLVGADGPIAVANLELFF